MGSGYGSWHHSALWSQVWCESSGKWHRAIQWCVVTDLVCYSERLLEVWCTVLTYGHQQVSNRCRPLNAPVTMACHVSIRFSAHLCTYSSLELCTSTSKGRVKERYEHGIIAKDQWPPNVQDLNILDYPSVGYHNARGILQVPSKNESMPVVELKEMFAVSLKQPSSGTDREGCGGILKSTEGLCCSWGWRLWTFWVIDIVDMNL